MNNIILIGMPGVGKTTLGKMLSEKLGRAFVDTDAEIERVAGVSVQTIFAEYGEARFREIESETIANVKNLADAIVATGGGAILKAENRETLRRSGQVCLILRDLEQLSLAGRPLSKSYESLKVMWAVREPLYRATADFTIDNNARIEDALENILHKIL